MNYLALFASGSGSNVENIINYFHKNSFIKVEIIICNNKNAYVLERCQRLKIPYQLIDNKSISSNKLLFLLESKKITHIILAGYTKLIPKIIIENFKNKILNIHPALLPKFGGKGYYGNYVHQRVLESNEIKSGITIHLVNEKYDEGKILFQKEIMIYENETIESLSSKIHKIEHKFFPQIIEKYILNQL